MKQNINKCELRSITLLIFSELILQDLVSHHFHYVHTQHLLNLRKNLLKNFSIQYFCVFLVPIQDKRSKQTIKIVSKSLETGVTLHYLFIFFSYT